MESFFRKKSTGDIQGIHNPDPYLWEQKLQMLQSQTEKCEHNCAKIQQDNTDNCLQIKKMLSQFYKEENTKWPQIQNISKQIESICDSTDSCNKGVEEIQAVQASQLKELEEYIHNELMATYYHIQSTCTDESQKQNELLKQSIDNILSSINLQFQRMNQEISMQYDAKLDGVCEHIDQLLLKNKKTSVANMIISIISLVSVLLCLFTIAVLELL